MKRRSDARTSLSFLFSQEDSTMKNLVPIFNHFITAGNFCNATPHGSGHIHSTYLINTQENEAPDYILQKINHHVFPDVELLMGNIRKITNYLHENCKQDDQFKVLTPVRTRTKTIYFKDDEGNYWRIFENVMDSISYNEAANPLIAFEAGKAYGHFIYCLREFPVQSLEPVIPHFHSLSKRFSDFEKVLSDDPMSRKVIAEAEIQAVYRQVDEMMRIPRLQSEGRLPLRITHNDTKINNVLFDRRGRAICVIDLDTVMPGLSLYDFGDAIRTAAATAAEDVQDLSKMQIDLQIFEAFAKGFLEKTRSILTRDEIDNLAFSCRYIAFLQAMRFLTDYLNGDKYYKTAYENHNLVRARAQFGLEESMSENFGEMQKIIVKEI